MSDALARLVDRAPPRPRSEITPLLRAATRGYRLVGWMIWGTVVLVGVFVGVTSAPGQKLEITIYGLLGLGLLLGLPVQIFVRVNVRSVRDCLERGVRVPARIVQVRRRGDTGRKVEEIEVELAHPSGGRRRAFASGVTTGAAPGTELAALVAPDRPDLAALVLGGGTIAVARVV